MITHAHNAITNLRNRLRNLRKEEDGFSLIELHWTTLIMAAFGTMLAATLINATITMATFIKDPHEGKTTVALTDTLQREAAHIIATTPQDTRVGAVINTADFDATLRAKTSQAIPSTYHYYLCKTSHSQVFIAAYDTARPEDNFTKARPYATNGYGLDISGMNGVACGQWEKEDRYSKDAYGNKFLVAKAGDFIWEPIQFGTL